MSYIKANLPTILNHIKNIQRNQIVYQAKLLEIYEGSIEKYIRQSMKDEFSEHAYARAVERIAPINIVPKVINKLSGVYNCGAHREVFGNDVDKANVTYFEDHLALDAVMNLANQYLNLFRSCAIEPYIYKGKPQLRVIPPTGFVVWSGDQQNPIIPEVFVKFVGKSKSYQGPTTDTYGVSNLQENNVVEEVDLFYMYSDDEFLIVDSKGVVRYDLMEGNQGVNLYGKIPFVYLSTSKNFLIPLPNSDMFKMAVLIPKLFTDMNYANKFQSHSIIYGMNVETKVKDFNPDTYWDLKSDLNQDGTRASGTLNTIKPEADVDKVLNLIKGHLVTWFDSLGIKTSGVNSMSATNASESGIAKLIDNADISEVVNTQKPIMRKAEHELWGIVSSLVAFWSGNRELDMNKVRPFSTDFDVAIGYKEKEVKSDPKIPVEVAKMKLDAGLTSFKRALRTANPELNEEELVELIAEMKAEKEEALALTLPIIPEGNVE